MSLSPLTDLNRDKMPPPVSYYLLSAGLKVRQGWIRLKLELAWEKCRRDGIGHLHLERCFYAEGSNVVRRFCDYCGAPLGAVALEDYEHKERIFELLEAARNRAEDD